jgi:hypothetical protein
MIISYQRSLVNYRPSLNFVHAFIGVYLLVECIHIILPKESSGRLFPVRSVNDQPRGGFLKKKKRIVCNGQGHFLCMIKL